MKSVRLMLVALSSVLLSLVVLPTNVAQAYPDPVCNITVSATELEGGEPLTISVTSDIEADLSVTFLGETRSEENATVLEETFQTPRVSRESTRTIEASCDGVLRSAEITLLPAGADADSGDVTDDVSGLLPDTGGAPFWLLLLGILLAVSGGALVARHRRA